jgi:hypothetical protein
VENKQPFVKDHFHEVVVNGAEANPANNGTKMAPVYQLNIGGGKSAEIKLRLSKEKSNKNPLLKVFDTIFSERQKEADEFYANLQKASASKDSNNIQRQAWAGMLWSKQYYNIDIPVWLNGDKNQPIAPPESRKTGRNSQWHTLNNEDIFPCPTSGNILGMPHGTWLFIASHWPWWMPILPKSNCCFSCVNGTCTPTARYLPTNGPLAM